MPVFDSNPFEPDTLLQQQKEYPENAGATKVLNRAKKLILGSLQMFPTTFAQIALCAATL